MDKNCILAIDLGTSGPKITVLTLAGEVLANAYEKVEILYVENGGVEQDPRAWWEAIRQGVRGLLQENPALRERIGALCCGGQWSGTVPIDESGDPIGNAIIWMDSRGSKEIQTLIQGWLNVEGYGLSKLLQWIRKTGGAPGKSGKDSLAHILHIKSQRPDIYKRTWKFLEPKDYINYKLTKKIASSFDTMALHWVTDNRNIKNIVYDDKLLKLAGLSLDKFPKLYKSTDILGELTAAAAEELGLPQGIPVVVGSPDIQTAAIGSGAVADFSAHLCLGTSSWLTCHLPYKKTDLLHNMATLPSALEGRYFAANEQESAGLCLVYLYQSILGGFGADLDSISMDTIDYQRLEMLAQKSRCGSHNLIFTPWLNGERTPVESHTLRGGFHNLSLTHKVHDIVRSVYEGVAFNSRWLLSTVENFVNKRLDDIHVIGGGAQSDLWCQIHADTLGRTIKQVDEPRFANARGSAWIAALALGSISLEDIPRLVKVKQVYHPNEKNHNTYTDSFKEFINIYKANRKVYARLNSELH